MSAMTTCKCGYPVAPCEGAAYCTREIPPRPASRSDSDATFNDWWDKEVEAGRAVRNADKSLALRAWLAAWTAMLVRSEQQPRKMVYATPEAYAAVNPMGGPAVIFEAMANRIRAGEDFYSVIDDYGLESKSAAPSERYTPDA